MQADGHTDGQGANDNEYTPTPSQEENGIAIATNVFGDSFIESSMFGREITIRESFLPTIVFGNLR